MNNENEYKIEYLRRFFYINLSISMWPFWKTRFCISLNKHTFNNNQGIPLLRLIINNPAS